MFRRYMAVLAIMTVLAVILAGCGGNSSSGTGGGGGGGSIIGTWQVASATKDGASDTVNDALGNPPGTTASTVTFGSDGNFLATNWGAGNTVVDQQSGTWSASGNALMCQRTQPDVETWPTMTYSVNGPGTQATLSFTGPSGSPNAGHTIAFTCNKVTTAGAGLDANLVGIWQAKATDSATLGGQPSTVSVVTGMDPGETALTIMLAADGGYLLIDYSGTTQINVESGTWTAVNGTLTQNRINPNSRTRAVTYFVISSISVRIIIPNVNDTGLDGVFTVNKIG